ncbi:UdgX family uracil-DNA binding protein [Leptospira interrogans]
MPTVLAEPDAELRNLARDARGCQRCPLYKMGTQTVFGAGPADARVMLVGEQPGDVEDRRGLPFVGPAGRLLDQAIETAGLKRDRMYVTNAVKHFKHVERGKRRLHQKPNVYEIDRCKWWLDLELEIIAPKLTVALGATAVRSLTGRPGKIEQMRSHIRETSDGRPLLVTVHPSAILRLREDDMRIREMRRFVADLEMIADIVPSARR